MSKKNEAVTDPDEPRNSEPDQVKVEPTPMEILETARRSRTDSFYKCSRNLPTGQRT